MDRENVLRGLLGIRKKENTAWKVPGTTVWFGGPGVSWVGNGEELLRYTIRFIYLIFKLNVLGWHCLIRSCFKCTFL